MNKIVKNFYYVSGDESNNYLNVGIVTGGITVTMQVGTGSLDMFIKPNRIRFDDNQWHKISVTRKVQGVRELILYNSFYTLITRDNLFIH